MRTRNRKAESLGLIAMLPLIWLVTYYSVAVSPPLVYAHTFGPAYLALQDVPMPPPGGNPDHSEPAPGAFCTHGGSAAHACACESTCEPILDGNGDPIPGAGERRVEDNAKCRAACHKDHCHCPSPCTP